MTTTTTAACPLATFVECVDQRIGQHFAVFLLQHWIDVHTGLLDDLPKGTRPEDHLRGRPDEIFLAAGIPEEWLPEVRHLIRDTPQDEFLHTLDASCTYEDCDAAVYAHMRGVATTVDDETIVVEASVCFEHQHPWAQAMDATFKDGRLTNRAIVLGRLTNRHSTEVVG